MSEPPLDVLRAALALVPETQYAPSDVLTDALAALAQLEEERRKWEVAEKDYEAMYEQAADLAEQNRLLTEALRRACVDLAGTPGEANALFRAYLRAASEATEEDA